MVFKFKKFSIEQDNCTMKVGTDGVLLGAWANVEKAKSILDIGTGTGVIAIMLAQRATEAKVSGIEIDEAACTQAQQNMDASPYADRLTAELSPIQDFAKLSREEFDLIVSNPPFFSGGTFSENQDRNSVRHTVKLSHGDLLMAVQKLLSKTGKFCLILPYLEGLRFQEMAKNYNLFCTKMTEVKPKKEKSVERLLLQFERKEKAIKIDQIVIQKEARNDWTKEYIALTGDFYLKM